MNKIKLVVSDLHMGNGRHLADGTVNPLEDFLHDEKFIEFLNHYGEHGRDQAVELILNGDFFNMIQLMPEEQELGILTERAAIAKVEAIMAGHLDLFEALRSFNTSSKRRIVFVGGNHDPGLLWKGVQESVRRRIQGEIVFVDEAYRFDGVHIEHGHQLEPIFRFDRERYFLTKGFPEPVLNLPWGVYFVKDYLYRIKRRRPYADKVKPYGKYLRWCLWNDFLFGISSVFTYFWFVIKTRFSRFPLKRSGAFKGIGAVWDLARTPTMTKDAERLVAEEGCRIVVLGHTHIPVHKRFGNAEYLNPGTWNDMTSLDIPTLGHRRRFIYVLIEYRGDRPVARLMEWFGFQRPFEEVRA